MSEDVPLAKAHMSMERDHPDHANTLLRQLPPLYNIIERPGGVPGDGMKIRDPVRKSRSLFPYASTLSRSADTIPRPKYDRTRIIPLLVVSALIWIFAFLYLTAG